MDRASSVLEYKCPCCNAPLIFGGEQQLRCEYCDNTFDFETVRAYSESDEQIHSPEINWEQASAHQWSDEEQSSMRSYLCDACAGELLTDDHTAATFCPYCGNPAILPGRLSDSLKPEGVIPFKTSKDDAKKAFLNLCKGKPLLPRFFMEDHQVDKITGIYVPFWLYDCSAEVNGTYKATRIHTWMDSRYTYTKTDHYMLRRQADAMFSGIPMDASSKMDDSFMESIEPYDYSAITDFNTAYLSGFLADKYDVESKAGENRIMERVKNAMDDQIQSSMLGYASVIPTSHRLSVDHSKAKYVLLPVWMLNTKYNGKIYTFAMNGQTGKMTGEFPVCPKRSAAWFMGLWAIFTALSVIVQLVL